MGLRSWVCGHGSAVMGLRCKRCGSEEQVRNGLMRSKQRYRCKACGLNFTDTPARGKPLAMRATAVLLRGSVVCRRLVDEPHGQVARRLDTHHPGLARAVRRRLRAEARARRSGHRDRARRDVARSQKKSEPLWIWKAWDRASGQLVDWECGGRDKAACERLIARLTRWRTRLYGTDDYAVYDVLLPLGQRSAGKDETHGIERDNAPQRHWLARFRRRSIVVSKPSASWTSASRCSPVPQETAGSATYYLR